MQLPVLNLSLNCSSVRRLLTNLFPLEASWLASKANSPVQTRANLPTYLPIYLSIPVAIGAVAKLFSLLASYFLACLPVYLLVSPTI
ncbi:hypothetical protein BJX76DRAFT_317437 [Aspergillus varians]